MRDQVARPLWPAVPLDVRGGVGFSPPSAERKGNIEFLLAAFSVLLYDLRTITRSLPHMTPRRINVSSRHLLRTSRTVRQTVSRGRVPKTMLTIVHRNGVTCLGTCNGGQVCPGMRPVRVGAIFSVTSYDGSVSATISIVVLIRQKRLHLLSHIDFCLPSFRR